MYSAQNVESSKQNATLARRYLNVTQREEVHKKAFTKWVNSRLAQADPPIEIKNLDRDFCDGIALLSLLEVLLDIRTQRDAGKTRVHRLNNVQRALQICSEHGIQLFGISASDIVNGTRKTTLGLIWNIILHFQLQNPTKSDSKDFSVERALQEWCQERLERYKDLVTIRDFSKSWRDGLAFNAILHSYRGSLFDFGKIIQQDTFTRLDNAFSTANLVWSVPKLLDPSDVDVEKPDKKMITMYLSCLYEKIIANPHGNLPEGITSSEESIALPSRDAESANQEEAPDDIEGLPVKTKKVLEASPARMEQISPLDINLNNIENINRVDETHHLYSKADNETSAHDKSNANNTQELPLEISTAGPMSQTSTAVTENDRKTDFKDIYQLPTTKADSSAHVTKEKVQVIRTSGGQGISEGSRVTRIITKRTVTTHKVPSFTNPQSTRSNPRVKKKVFYLKKNTPRSSHARSSPQFPPISIEETKTIRINSVSSCTPSTSSVSLDGQATDGKKNRTRKRNRHRKQLTPLTYPYSRLQTLDEDSDLLERRVDHSKMYSFSSISDSESSPENNDDDLLSQDSAIGDMGTIISRGPQTPYSANLAKSKSDTTIHRLRGEPDPIASREQRSKLLSSSKSESVPLMNESCRDFPYSPKDKTYNKTVLLADLKKRGFRTSGSNTNIDYEAYLDRRLEDAESSITDLEQCLPMSHSDSIDLGFAKKTLDETKVVVYTLDKLKFGVQDVIRLGRGLVDDGYFDEKTSHGFTRRINILENRLNDLRAHSSKEMARLYDLYVILLRQNIDRIHDWLLRAESRMTLDDGIGPTHDDVLQQQKEHFEFQKDLGVFSSINMIFEIDVEDLLLDKHLSEEVQSASERWAKVFNWAEERKQRLNEVLFDWEQLRNSEREILEWMREREYELEVVGSTDITNGEEVAEHIRVLQDAVDQLNQGGRRLDTLRNISVRLIADAQYSDSVAQRIKSEVQDFDDCWRSALENTTSRIAQLTCARERFLEMSALVQNVKEWLCGVEDILRKSNESTGKQKDEERSCLHEIELKYDQRYEKHLKVDRITQLEAAIAEEIDQPSHDAMHLVTTNLIKRYQEACEGLERRREGLPLPQHDDCCLMKYLKRRIMFGGYPEKFANFFTK
ncbi:dystrophin isoform X2 [Nematostella vectensis]|uniref:dystrophin isoform X2 n=1 Tax=Nematostella vectensis TaxID=45351 RepID=UPI00207783C4|nr:dystrophin isoform X2 [Nematostella vectensis]